MKVLIDAQSVVVEFAKLQPGDVFRVPNVEDIFMVVFEDTDPTPGHLQSNAVNLKTGELCCFGNVLVEKLHAVLHIIAR